MSMENVERFLEGLAAFNRGDLETWKRAFGGCHLPRPVVQLLANAGFTITELDVIYEDGAPR